MSDCVLDIKIGVDNTQTKELYKTIDINVEMHQEKLIKINQQLCTILGKTNTPFIVIEYPHLSLQNCDIFDFKGKDYECGYHQNNNKLYQYANPRNKDTIKLIKNIEKEFQKLSKFNNTANIKLSLYDVLGRQKNSPALNLLNHAKIKGHLQTDQELMNSLTEVMRRISNQFLNSPIMAFLQLLEQFAFKVELQSVDSFPQQLKKSIKSWFDFGSWINKENLSKISEIKGDIVINISLPKLLCVRIKTEISVLSQFLRINE